MRTVVVSGLIVVVAWSSPALAADSPGEKEGGAAKHVQSAAVQEFRKSAIPVTFSSRGVMLRGWIYKPAGDGPFPTVIWNHGSEREPTAHPELGLFYTRHGYAMFLPVRGGHGRSPGTYIQDALDAYSAKEKDRAAVSRKLIELQEAANRDVAAAIAWVKEQSWVDQTRLVVSGCSYGGIQTLLTAEKDSGVRAFVPFAPGAMSWSNVALRRRLTDAVGRATAPVFLIQSQSDYSTGPSDVLGPLIKQRGGANRAKLYPAFGKSPAEGHAGFACWEEGVAIWGPDVLSFLKDAGADPR